MPLADASFDVVVSFETLEHIPAQEEFLAEVARVLKPEGVLVLSCPNKLEYSDKRDFANEFHVKELYRDELAALVGRRFPASLWFGQRPSFFSVIAPEGAPAAAGEFLEVAEAEPGKAATQLGRPLYFLLVASRSHAAVENTPPALSVLSDRDDWVHRDYEKVMRDLAGTAAQRDYAEKLVAERDATIVELHAEWEKQRAAAAARLQQVLDESAGTLAERDQQIHAREAIIADQAHEIARRLSVRWWLKLPFIRLRSLLRGR